MNMQLMTKFFTGRKESGVVTVINVRNHKQFSRFIDAAEKYSKEYLNQRLDYMFCGFELYKHETCFVFNDYSNILGTIDTGTLNAMNQLINESFKKEHSVKRFELHDFNELGLSYDD